MRGKGYLNVPVPVADGITPAYAGKSISRYVSVCFNRNHPRICGEKAVNIDARIGKLGSPPHMRGKGVSKHLPSVRRGITPAYAGKSTDALVILVRFGDHPRICGEKK